MEELKQYPVKRCSECIRPICQRKLNIKKTHSLDIDNSINEVSMPHNFTMVG